MNSDGDREAPSVRLLFEMSRDDNPRLYDDLMRFNKGPKRVNRLRFLAHEGLLAQHWVLPAVAPAAPSTAAVVPTGSYVDRTVARQTNQAFAMPSDGDDD